MFGFDDQLHLAKAWGDAVLAYMTAASQITTSMLGPLQQGSSVFSPARTDPEPSVTRVQGWSGRSAPPTGTSWYRPPEHSPFEPSWLSLAWVTPLASPMAMTPQAMLGPLQPLEAWSRLLQASTPSMAIGLPATRLPLNPMSWLSPVSWPITSLPIAFGMASAMLGSAPGHAPPAEAPQFAAYRSDSGHAVAQITFPNNLVAAVAVPENATSLFDAFFPWQRMVH